MDEDRDMMSEKTGLFIAQSRAEIKTLIAARDALKNEINGLKKFYYTVNQSKNYHEGAYMETMLRRQIMMRENDLSAIREEIKQAKQSLKTYLKDKGDFYTKIRKNRQANND